MNPKFVACKDKTISNVISNLVCRLLSQNFHNDLVWSQIARFIFIILFLIHSFHYIKMEIFKQFKRVKDSYTIKLILHGVRKMKKREIWKNILEVCMTSLWIMEHHLGCCSPLTKICDPIIWSPMKLGHFIQN